MYTEVIFDIETQKLFADIDNFDPAKLGISIVSAYKRQLDEQLNEVSGQMFSFFPDQLASLWPLFTNVDRAIGFNSLKFDVPALAPLSPYDFAKINHFDIMDQFAQIAGHRIKLDHLAKSNLGRSKTDVGTNAVLYWQEHSPESLAKLQHYCEADVLVTRDVYDYGLKNKQLKYQDKWNTPRVIEVDFSYPKLTITPQMGLF